MNPFSLWLALGVTLGLWQVAHTGPPRERFVHLGLGVVVLLAALAGARLGYVLLHLGPFRAQPGLVPQVWQGGVTWVGALPGALLGLGGLAWGLRRPFLGLAERLLPLLPAVGAAAWLGCWGAGCAYGAPASPATWWALPVVDELGQSNWRWPLQPLAALTLLGGFGLLEAFLREAPPARRVGWGGLWFAAHTALFSLGRADVPPAWHGQRLDLPLCLILGASCAGLLVSTYLSRGRKAVR